VQAEAYAFCAAVLPFVNEADPAAAAALLATVPPRPSATVLPRVKGAGLEDGGWRVEGSRFEGCGGVGGGGVEG
jgi:hypothetical protein